MKKCWTTDGEPHKTIQSQRTNDQFKQWALATNPFLQQRERPVADPRQEIDPHETTIIPKQQSINLGNRFHDFPLHIESQPGSVLAVHNELIEIEQSLAFTRHRIRSLEQKHHVLRESFENTHVSLHLAKKDREHNYNQLQSIRPDVVQPPKPSPTTSHGNEKAEATQIYDHACKELEGNQEQKRELVHHLGVLKEAILSSRTTREDTDLNYVLELDPFATANTDHLQVFRTTVDVLTEELITLQRHQLQLEDQVSSSRLKLEGLDKATIDGERLNYCRDHRLTEIRRFTGEEIDSLCRRLQLREHKLSEEIQLYDETLEAKSNDLRQLVLEMENALVHKVQIESEIMKKEVALYQLKYENNLLLLGPFAIPDQHSKLTANSSTKVLTKASTSAIEHRVNDKLVRDIQQFMKTCRESEVSQRPNEEEEPHDKPKILIPAKVFEKLCSENVETIRVNMSKQVLDLADEAKAFGRVSKSMKNMYRRALDTTTETRREYQWKYRLDMQAFEAHVNSGSPYELEHRLQHSIHQFEDHQKHQSVNSRTGMDQDPTGLNSIAFVEVTVVSARDLPVMKRISRSTNSSVRVELCSESSNHCRPAKQTSIQSDTLYPSWHETFRFSQLHSLDATLQLTVLNEREGRGLIRSQASQLKSIIAAVDIPLAELRHQRKILKWFPLHSERQRLDSNCALQLRLQCSYSREARLRKHIQRLMEAYLKKYQCLPTYLEPLSLREAKRWSLDEDQEAEACRHSIIICFPSSFLLASCVSPSGVLHQESLTSNDTQI